MHRSLFLKFLLAFILILTLTACPGGTENETKGKLEVNIIGLPNGVAADVTVTGPDAFNQSVSSSTTLSNLTPGSYDVTAANVTNGGTFNPAISGSPAAVTAGNTSAVSVVYTELDAFCPTPAVLDNLACFYDDLTATYGP